MNRALLYGAIICITMGAIFFTIWASLIRTEAVAVSNQHKSAEYHINGVRIALRDGVHESFATSASDSKIITRALDIEGRGDVNNDGKEDVIFLMTQEMRGIGVYFHVVAAISTDVGYVGTESFMLGDRILPQSIKVSEDKTILISYRDRAPGEPFVVTPTVPKTVLLQVDLQTLTLREVVENGLE